MEPRTSTSKLSWSVAMGRRLMTCIVLLGVFLSAVDGQQNDGTTWTFNQPGYSYMTFHPELAQGKDQHYILTFRTRKANGLLLRHYVKNLEKADIPVLKEYQMFWELREGRLRVGYIVNKFQDFMNIGKALDDDQWHTVELFIFVKQSQMKLVLDNTIDTETLKSYSWGNAKTALLWDHLDSLITIGGVEATSVFDIEPFVGCIRDVEYVRADGTLTPVIFNVTNAVAPGCVDRCQVQNTCTLGRCINLYTSVKCDCYGTDHEGPFCDIEASTTMTFHGYEWVTYQLYEHRQDRLFMDKTRISLEFKTERGSGVLLYAVGGTPFYTHVTVSIYSGAVHVSMAFEQDGITFSGGIGLDDGRWHNLTIDHKGSIVMIYLDGTSSERRITKGENYLSLDPFLYIGGGDNFVRTKGLPVTQSFVGCLRNVYINDMSVLYELSKGNSRCVYNGGKAPAYGCNRITDVPISFPQPSSMLRWSGRDREQDLSVSFKIRSYRKMAIVLFVEVLSRKDKSSGFDFGSMELWLTNKMAELRFVPSTMDLKSHENLTLPTIVSDGTLHDVEVTLANSKAKLTVDGHAVYSRQYHKILEVRGSVIIGYSLHTVARHYGFVGCLYGIQIQGQRLDPIAVVESASAVGLLLDGCQLIDHCAKNNFCEHGSDCLSAWDGVHCLCQHGYYEGKACRFAKYSSTCEDYYRAGYRHSGVYMIDLDGIGPMNPTYVRCDMENPVLGGVTIVEHNFPPNTTVRAPWLGNRMYYLKYREMGREQLSKLTEISSVCEQQLKYDCIQSPLMLSQKTWFKSANGEIVDYIGSHDSGFCDCPSDTGCDGKHCYCDHGKNISMSDSGYNSARTQLPIMDMFFVNIKDAHGQGQMTLGSLQCWGSESQPSGKSITIIRKGGYVTFDPWMSGKLSIIFKTTEEEAMLIFQSSLIQEDKFGSQSPSKGNFFYAKLISESRVRFYFKLEKQAVIKTIQALNPLNQGEWHKISIEYDAYNIRLSLGSINILVDMPSGLNHPMSFEGHLFLGATPEKIAKSINDLTPGFTGCLYGFVYNGRTVDLQAAIDKTMNGISAECKSSCWPNPCQNGGVCEERWGDYTCVCSDPWAHMGSNCEKNLNEDAVTFTGEETSFLYFDVTASPNVLDGTLVLSFRTFHNEAFLVYVHNQMGDFVQLELTNSRTISISYNNRNQIVTETVECDVALNDGEWKQVVAENYHNFTRLMVMGFSKVIEVNRGKIQQYSLDPYYGSLKGPSVFIARTTAMPKPFIHAYLGGVKDSASSVSSLAGCVRGMRIGDRVFQLSAAAAALGNESLVSQNCKKGCTEDSCHNNGVCQEHWRNKQFSCDCDENGFSGKYCSIEPSVTLQGKTVVQHTFQLPVLDQYTVSEKLSFRFKAYTQFQQSKAMVVVYITSSVSKDYIIAFLEPTGSFMLETNQGIGIYRIKVAGKFNDGRSHDVSYIRKGSYMYLTVDEIKKANINFPDYPLNKIDNIFIGGYIKDDNSIDDVVNFTGCISNTVYIPKDSSSVSLYTLRDLYLNFPNIKVLGDKTESCSTSKLLQKTTSEAPMSNRVTSGMFKDLTMPPWDDRAIRMVTWSPPVQLSPSIGTASTTTAENRNNTFLVSSPNKEPVDDISIIIVVCVMAAVLIITLCIALIIVRRQKRHGDYLVKKEDNADIELKEPLNHMETMHYKSSPFNSNTMPKPSNRPQTSADGWISNDTPPDHLAKLDEFSMITAILGPRAPRADTLPHDLSRQRYNKGNYPLTEDEADFRNPIYNARKQRPASSISEVLEELERRQQPSVRESPDDHQNQIRSHGEGDLEWDPQADTRAAVPYVRNKTDTLEGSTSPPGSSHINSVTEGNGDSGYEAESRPEITEEDMTPETLDSEEMATRHKMFSFHIPETQNDSSPNLSDVSTQDNFLHEGTSV